MSYLMPVSKAAKVTNMSKDHKTLLPKAANPSAQYQKPNELQQHESRRAADKSFSLG